MKHFLLACCILFSGIVRSQYGYKPITDPAKFEEKYISDLVKVKGFGIGHTLNTSGWERPTIPTLPPSFSLKAYAPTPRDQYNLQTCVGWSCGYGAATILYNIKYFQFTDKDRVTDQAFSAGHAYRYGSKKNNCQEPIYPLDVLAVMREKGIVQERTYWNKGIDGSCISPSQVLARDRNSDFAKTDFLPFWQENTLDELSDYDKLFLIKRELSVGKRPIIVGMTIEPSFLSKNKPDDSLYVPNIVPESDYVHHAMVIIGYNDNIEGGVFEIMNSNGVSFRNEGFFYMRYSDFLRNTKLCAVMFHFL